jgi:hypothetical protein
MNILDASLIKLTTEKLDTQSDSISFSKLLEQRRHAYVFIDEKPEHIRRYLKEMELSYEDWSGQHDIVTKKYHITDLDTEWKNIPIKHNQYPKPYYIILLPSFQNIIAEKEMYELFDQMRTDILKWQNRHAPKIILLGSYSTFGKMLKEYKGLSALAKEFIAMNAVWLIESMYTKDDALKWLTGGDGETLRLLLNYWHICRDSKAFQTPSELWRAATHLFVKDWLLEEKPTDSHNPLALTRRLRHWLDIPTHTKAVDLAEGKEKFDLYFNKLINLLPGNYDKQNHNSRQAWNQQKENARWKSFFSNSEIKQSLITGGFIRYKYQNDIIYFCLRSPLLAYVISYYAKQHSYIRLHAPWRNQMLSILPNNIIERMPPTGLDLFLDKLLEKALEHDDGEEDHWAVVDINFDSILHSPNVKQGEWWKRLKLGSK